MQRNREILSTEHKNMLLNIWNGIDPNGANVWLKLQSGFSTCVRSHVNRKPIPSGCLKMPWSTGRVYATTTQARQSSTFKWMCSSFEAVYALRPQFHMFQSIIPETGDGTQNAAEWANTKESKTCTCACNVSSAEKTNAHRPAAGEERARARAQVAETTEARGDNRKIWWSKHKIAIIIGCYFILLVYSFQFRLGNERVCVCVLRSLTIEYLLFAPDDLRWFQFQCARTLHIHTHT